MARAPHIDPQLEDQLARASGGGDHESVAATFTLRSRDDSALSPTETKSVVDEVLERTERRTHAKPNDVNVFPNLQSFVVDASPAFVRELLRQPEIDSAMANEQQESMMIEPVKSREVSRDVVEGRAKRSSARKRSR